MNNVPDCGSSLIEGFQFGVLTGQASSHHFDQRQKFLAVASNLYEDIAMPNLHSREACCPGCNGLHQYSRAATRVEKV